MTTTAKDRQNLHNYETMRQRLADPSIQRHILAAACRGNKHARLLVDMFPAQIRDRAEKGIDAYRRLRHAPAHIRLQAAYGWLEGKIREIRYV